MDHVLVRTLSKHLLPLLILDVLKTILSVIKTASFAKDLIFDVSLISLGLLKLTLNQRKKWMSD